MRSLRRAVGALGSPGVALRWFRREVVATFDPLAAPARARSLDARALTRATGTESVDALWERCAARHHPARTTPPARGGPPSGASRVLQAAEAAIAHRVDLLGSGPVELGRSIDWHRDFKGHRRWPRGHFRSQRFVHPDDESDVKVPWELSRLQWALPLGQAALLTGDPRHAEAARELLESWIAENPCAFSVNWGVAMEPALRLLSWTWLFKVFARSPAWCEPSFRMEFLKALYLHADFVERHFEESIVNGNHMTADATGLLVAGLFFGGGRAPERWARQGWRLLQRELPRQVHPDGVDFEYAAGYHRLVLELFLLAALYRRACGLEVPEEYRERLIAMGHFAAAYTRPDGSAPAWGDADDARALPFGGQVPEDHGYLAGLVGRAFAVPELLGDPERSAEEAWWLLGDEGSAPAGEGAVLSSRSFCDAGVYVMRNPRDHIFVDCGSVGTGGRGGHGHNDCLSFDAVLDGERLVVDSGTYVYTSSLEERNRFRATAAHNTPRVDGAEVNRLDPRLLWSLEDDARPLSGVWRPGPGRDILQAGHTGYRRLAAAVVPWRSLVLEHATHRLIVRDRFWGEGEHLFEVPLHLGPGVAARPSGVGTVELETGGRGFRIAFAPADWTLRLSDARASRRYGVTEPIVRLEWSRRGPTCIPLTVVLAPRESADDGLLDWAYATLAAEGLE